MTNAIILAAGMGTRLGQYTKDLPKCMLSFLDKPIIQRQIETLKKVGIDDITVVKGYKGEKITYNVKFRENSLYTSTNMAESLNCARDKLKDTLVCYGDIIYETRLVEKLLDSKGEINVLVDDDWIPYWQSRLDNWREDTESLKYDSLDRLFEIGTPKCEPVDCQSRYIGLIKFTEKGSQKFLELYDINKSKYWENSEKWRKSKNFRNAYMTCMLQEAIDNKVDVRVAHTKQGWMEFDTIEDYEKATMWAKEGTLERFIKL
jgi:choline kinase